MSWIRLIRWLLVIPASIFGFCLACGLSVGLDLWLRKWCPLEEAEILTSVGGGLAAFLTVVSGAVAAPDDKRKEVAWSIYVFGGIIAAFIFYNGWPGPQKAPEFADLARRVVLWSAFLTFSSGLLAVLVCSRLTERKVSQLTNGASTPR